MSASTSSLPKFAPSPLARLIRSHLLRSTSPTQPLPTPSTSSPLHITLPNPFTSPPSAPRLSNRTQADLLKSFPAEWLPRSKKNLAGGRVINYEADGVTVNWTGTPSRGSLRSRSYPAATPSSSQSSSSSSASSRPRYKIPSEKTKADFKGTVAERKAEGRIEETKARMEGMEKRILDWKKEKKDAKIKVKPALPF